MARPGEQETFVLRRLLIRDLSRPLLAGAIFLLVSAMLGGLARMGWLPASGFHLEARHHGLLMVSGFLGTLISLERAKALAKPAGYLAPALKFFGALLLWTELRAWGPWLLVLGDLGLLLILLRFHLQQRELFTQALFLAGVSLLCADLAHAWNQPPSRIVHAWMGFLVLTIAAERLELGRLQRLPRNASRSFALLSYSLLPATWLQPRLAGALFALLGLWMLRYDIARRTIRFPGLPRFSAFCLMSGNLWLVLGGTLLAWQGSPAGGFFYDAILHSIFVGFVFSMIFAHAPVILPAVAGIPLPFRKRFYLHSILLHLSLLVRIGADLAGNPGMRLAAGLGNAGAIALFGLVTGSVALGAGLNRSAASKERPRASPRDGDQHARSGQRGAFLKA